MTSIPHSTTWLSARVSIYERANDSKGETAPLGAILEGVKTERWRAQVDKAKATMAQGDDIYRAAKAQLPGVTFAGVFSSTRRNANLETHSGVLVLDFDHHADAAELRDLAALNLSTVAAFLSPSREGFKVLVALSPVPADADEHAAAWRNVASAYAVDLGADVDESGKDVSRLCFVSCDSDIYIADEDSVQPFAWGDALDVDDTDGEYEAGDELPAVSETAGSVTQDDIPRHTLDLSALAYVEPPADYNEWVGWLPRLKSTGFTVAEIEAWSARGEKHQPGEVKGRWASLQTDPEDAARGVLYKAAKGQGWHKPRRPRARPAESPDSGRMGAIKYPELADNEAGAAWRLLGKYGSQILLATVGDNDWSSVYALDKPTGLWREDIDRLLKWHDLTCRAWLRKAVEMHAEGRMDPQEANRLIRHLHANQAKGFFAGVRDHCGAVAEEMQESEEQNDRERASLISRCYFSDFDRPTGTLAVGNGLVDLEAGLLPAEKAKGRLVRYRHKAVDYRPGATHPAVDKLFAHLNPQRADYLKACLGRALWGQPDKMFLVLVGPKDSGKGTLFLALRAALGSAGYVENISEDLLRGMSKQHKTGPTEERRALVESRIVLAEEASDWNISIERLKAYSGGAPEVTYQPKYGKETTRPASATIIMSANRMPKVDLDEVGLNSAGEVDRLRYIKYTAPGEKDPKLKAAFSPQTIDPKAAEAMLALLIQMARENPPGKEIEIPPVVLADILGAVEAGRSAFRTWLVKAVRPHQTRGVNLTTAMLWESWAAFNEKDAIADQTIGGLRRDDVSKAFRQCFNVPVPKSVRAGGKVGQGWHEFDLVAGCDQPDFLDDGEDLDRSSECEGGDCPGYANTPDKKRCGPCVEGIAAPMGAGANALFDLQDILPALLPQLGGWTTPNVTTFVEAGLRVLVDREQDFQRRQVPIQFDRDFEQLVLDGPMDGSPEALERLEVAEKVLQKGGGLGPEVPELAAAWDAMLDRVAARDPEWAPSIARVRANRAELEADQREKPDGEPAPGGQ